MHQKSTRSDLDRAMKFSGVAADANAGAAITHFLSVIRLKYQWVIRLKYAPDAPIDRAAYPFRADGIFMAAMLSLIEAIIAAYPSAFGGMNAAETFAAIHAEKLEALARKASQGEIEPTVIEVSKSRDQFRKFGQFVEADPAIDTEDFDPPEGNYPRLLYFSLIHVRRQRRAALAATGGKSHRNRFELDYWHNPSRKAVAAAVKGGKIPPFLNAWQAALKEIESNPRRAMMRSRSSPKAIELGKSSGRGRGFLSIAKVAKNQPNR